jgi:hypothetical protein
VEYDFNILRFVEHNYGIAEGALTFADRRATNDLSKFFKLTQAPRLFQHIRAPKGADYFLHDRTPMEPPDTD